MPLRVRTTWVLCKVVFKFQRRISVAFYVLNKTEGVFSHMIFWFCYHVLRPEAWFTSAVNTVMWTVYNGRVWDSRVSEVVACLCAVVVPVWSGATATLPSFVVQLVVRRWCWLELLNGTLLSSVRMDFSLSTILSVNTLDMSVYPLNYCSCCCTYTCMYFTHACTVHCIKSHFSAKLNCVRQEHKPARGRFLLPWPWLWPYDLETVSGHRYSQDVSPHRKWSCEVKPFDSYGLNK